MLPSLQSDYWVEQSFLDDLIEGRESLDLEFKLAEKGFPNTFWDTYSAFANSEGGTIILGVREQEDRFEYARLSRETIDKYIQDFWNSVNDPQTISANLLSEDDVRVNYDLGVVAFHIPKASYRDRPIYRGKNIFTGTYRRQGEGDYRCREREVVQMRQDALLDVQPYDSGLLKHYRITELDARSVQQYRRLFDSRTAAHPWSSLTDEEFLLMIGALQEDRATQAVWLTRAGLLMFGKHRHILEVFPRFFVDYRELFDEGNRWSHRIYPDGTWEANLFQYYWQVLPELRKRVPTPFQLEAGVRIEDTPAHTALREALANSLIHADYTEGSNVLVEVHKEYIRFTNAGELLISIADYYRGGKSVCRNPRLQNIFVLAGLAERAGSGVSKIISGWEAYERPLLDLSAVPLQVRLIFTFRHILPEETLSALTQRFGNTLADLSADELQILSYAVSVPEFRHSDALSWVDMHQADLTKVLRGLRDKGFLLSTGVARGTCYRIGGQAPNLSQDVSQDVSQDNLQRDSILPYLDHLVKSLLEYCITPRTMRELLSFVKEENRGRFRSKYLDALIECGLIAMQFPDKPTSRHQRYYTTQLGKEKNEIR